MPPQLIIYALTDPRTGQVRYIGQSTTGEARARAHMQPTKAAHSNTHKENWVNSLRADGLIYGVHVVEEAGCIADLDEAEIWWIAHGREQGWPLTNITAGGNVGARGRRATTEQRARMSEVQRARPPVSAETRARMSASFKGRKLSPATIEKIRSKTIGQKRSDETRERMRTAALMRPPRDGTPKTIEQRAAQSEFKRTWWAARKAAGITGRTGSWP